MNYPLCRWRLIPDRIIEQFLAHSDELVGVHLILVLELISVLFLLMATPEMADSILRSDTGTSVLLHSR